MSEAVGAVIFEGFLLGASLIVAIGAQNAFVLRQGLRRRHVFAVAMVCAASDAVLIAAGVAGLGSVVRAAPGLLRVVTVIGALFLVAYGAMAARRAWQGESLAASDSDEQSLGAALTTCLALTFLNPHVYLDTVVLIGAISARYQPPRDAAFGAGAALASAVWFFGLAYGARIVAPLFARKNAWRLFDSLVALVMWAIAARLIADLA
jgi:L-lysine exporter family protein LysE/ArgO